MIKIGNIDIPPLDSEIDRAWQDDYTEIITDVYDHKGNKVNIKSQIQNMKNDFRIILIKDYIICVEAIINR